ncbi:hypothetical protein NBE98_00440 [Clostridium swellfunianum]|uniref:hypothetical protein n=1 Tax=Clostridium swellfunianum TaxID=1367462 RepID=UPI002030B7A2|nr:hypothetical protein [Clostridium swellfunianum]MCM0646838.1 hypothetical protein [Clostridium swellfunianum]
MSGRKLIETYYSDINNLTELLGKLVNSYRLLIGGADELNKIALSKRKDVKEALKRADELGEIIDSIIEVLEGASHNYLEYCLLKSEFMKGKMAAHHIETEIDEELKFNEVNKD